MSESNMEKIAADPETTKRLALIVRFMAKVNKDGPIVRAELGPCWAWTASCNVRRRGYGQIMIDRQPHGAHRVSYELHVGPIPDGLWVLHRCDNPPCVNPRHLFLGTAADNVRDMHEKGRAAEMSPVMKVHAARGDRNGSRTRPDRVRRGESNPQSKLTDDQVREFRARRLAGQSLRAIAADYPVGIVQVGRICAGQSRAATC